MNECLNTYNNFFYANVCIQIIEMYEIIYYQYQIMKLQDIKNWLSKSNTLIQNYDNFFKAIPQNSLISLPNFIKFLTQNKSSFDQIASNNKIQQVILKLNNQIQKITLYFAYIKTIPQNTIQRLLQEIIFALNYYNYSFFIPQQYNHHLNKQIINQNLKKVNQLLNAMKSRKIIENFPLINQFQQGSQIKLLNDLQTLKKLLHPVENFELFRLLKQKQKNNKKNQFEGAKILLFLGYLGSGKTTTVVTFLGHQMTKQKYANMTGINTKDKLEGKQKLLVISPQSRSITQQYCCIKLNNKLISQQHLTKNVFLCDSPGLSYIHSIEIELANKLQLDMIIKDREQIKLVIIINKDSLGEKLKQLKKLVETLNNMMPKYQKVKNNVSYVYNRIDKDIYHQLKNLRQIQKKQNVSKNISYIYDDIIEKSKTQNIMIINPEDEKNSRQILRKILILKNIEKDKKLFDFGLPKQVQQCLDKQIQKIKMYLDYHLKQHSFINYYYFLQKLQYFQNKFTTKNTLKQFQEKFAKLLNQSIKNTNKKMQNYQFQKKEAQLYFKIFQYLKWLQQNSIKNIFKIQQELEDPQQIFQDVIQKFNYEISQQNYKLIQKKVKFFRLLNQQAKVGIELNRLKISIQKLANSIKQYQKYWLKIKIINLLNNNFISDIKVNYILNDLKSQYQNFFRQKIDYLLTNKSRFFEKMQSFLLNLTKIKEMKPLVSNHQEEIRILHEIQQISQNIRQIILNQIKKWFQKLSLTKEIQQIQLLLEKILQRLKQIFKSKIILDQSTIFNNIYDFLYLKQQELLNTDVKKNKKQVKIIQDKIKHSISIKQLYDRFMEIMNDKQKKKMKQKKQQFINRITEKITQQIQNYQNQKWIANILIIKIWDKQSIKIFQQILNSIKDYTGLGNVNKKFNLQIITSIKNKNQNKISQFLHQVKNQIIKPLKSYKNNQRESIINLKNLILLQQIIKILKIFYHQCVSNSLSQQFNAISKQFNQDLEKQIEEFVRDHFIKIKKMMKYIKQKKDQLKLQEIVSKKKQNDQLKKFFGALIQLNKKDQTNLNYLKINDHQLQEIFSTVEQIYEQFEYNLKLKFISISDIQTLLLLDAKIKIMAPLFELFIKNINKNKLKISVQSEISNLQEKLKKNFDNYVEQLSERGLNKCNQQLELLRKLNQHKFKDYVSKKLEDVILKQLDIVSHLNKIRSNHFKSYKTIIDLLQTHYNKLLILYHFKHHYSHHYQQQISLAIQHIRTFVKELYSKILQQIQHQFQSFETQEDLYNSIYEELNELSQIEQKIQFLDINNNYKQSIEKKRSIFQEISKNFDNVTNSENNKAIQMLINKYNQFHSGYQKNRKFYKELKKIIDKKCIQHFTKLFYDQYCQLFIDDNMKFMQDTTIKLQKYISQIVSLKTQLLNGIKNIKNEFFKKNKSFKEQFKNKIVNNEDLKNKILEWLKQQNKFSGYATNIIKIEIKQLIKNENNMNKLANIYRGYIQILKIQRPQLYKQLFSAIQKKYKQKITQLINQLNHQKNILILNNFKSQIHDWFNGFKIINSVLLRANICKLISQLLKKLQISIQKLNIDFDNHKIQESVGLYQQLILIKQFYELTIKKYQQIDNKTNDQQKIKQSLEKQLRECQRTKQKIFNQIQNSYNFLKNLDFKQYSQQKSCELLQQKLKSCKIIQFYGKYKFDQINCNQLCQIPYQLLIKQLKSINQLLKRILYNPTQIKKLDIELIDQIYSYKWKLIQNIFSMFKNQDLKNLKENISISINSILQNSIQIQKNQSLLVNKIKSLHLRKDQEHLPLIKQKIVKYIANKSIIYMLCTLISPVNQDTYKDRILLQKYVKQLPYIIQDIKSQLDKNYGKIGKIIINKNNLRIKNERQNKNEVQNNINQYDKQMEEFEKKNNMNLSKKVYELFYQFLQNYKKLKDSEKNKQKLIQNIKNLINHQLIQQFNQSILIKIAASLYLLYIKYFTNQDQNINISSFLIIIIALQSDQTQLFQNLIFKTQNLNIVIFLVISSIYSLMDYKVHICCDSKHIKNKYIAESKQFLRIFRFQHSIIFGTLIQIVECLISNTNLQEIFKYVLGIVQQIKINDKTLILMNRFDMKLKEELCLKFYEPYFYVQQYEDINTFINIVLKSKKRIIKNLKQYQQIKFKYPLLIELIEQNLNRIRNSLEYSDKISEKLDEQQKRIKIYLGMYNYYDIFFKFNPTIVFTKILQHKILVESHQKQIKLQKYDFIEQKNNQTIIKKSKIIIFSRKQFIQKLLSIMKFKNQQSTFLIIFDTAQLAKQFYQCPKLKKLQQIKERCILFTNDCQQINIDKLFKEKGKIVVSCNDVKLQSILKKQTMKNINQFIKIFQNVISDNLNENYLDFFSLINGNTYLFNQQILKLNGIKNQSNNLLQKLIQLTKNHHKKIYQIENQICQYRKKQSRYLTSTNLINHVISNQYQKITKSDILQINNSHQSSKIPQRTIILIDCSYPLLKLLMSAIKLVLFQLFEHAKSHNNSIQVQIAIYKNYYSSDQQIFKVSSFQNNANSLVVFLENISTDNCEEKSALEIGFSHINKMRNFVKNVILIGYSMYNYIQKQQKALRFEKNQLFFVRGSQYWAKSKFRNVQTLQIQINNLKKNKSCMNCVYINQADNSKFYKQLADQTKGQYINIINKQDFEIKLRDFILSIISKQMQKS